MATEKRKPRVLEVTQALWTQAHALEARSRWMQRHVGVTGPQRVLLRYVGENPDSAPADAARWLRLDPGTVSRRVGGLERAGMLRRKPDRDDGRRQVLVLTPRGERLGADPRGTVEEAVRTALRASGRSEALSAVRFAVRLTGGLTELGNAPPLRRESSRGTPCVRKRSRRPSGHSPFRTPSAAAGRGRTRGPNLIPIGWKAETP